MKAKVDVDYGTTRLDITGVTALQAACGRGHLGVVRLLLKAKATVDQRSSDGAAALYYASEQNQPASVQLLLEAKATVDAPTDVGWTPLIVTAQNGHAPVVQLLLDAKASTTWRESDGKTALDAARHFKHAACVALLDPDAPAPPPEPAPEAKPHVPSALGDKLTKAALFGEIALLKRLLKSKTIDVDYRNSVDYTALQMASTLSLIHI